VRVYGILIFLIIWGNFLPAQVKISAVNFDTITPYEYDEAIEIINTSANTIDISNYAISDGAGNKIYFPSGVMISAGDRIWVSWQAYYFQKQFGFLPDFEAVDTNATVPEMIGSWPGFANDGDEVFLYDSNNQVIDVVIYGNSNYSGSGWFGGPVQLDPYAYAIEGQIIERDRLETNSGVENDTDTAADFDDYRTFYPGQTHYTATSFTITGTLTAAASPDSNYQLLINEINNAATSIKIAVYDFENIYIANALVSALNRNVSVKVLLEGSPVGGISNQQKYITKMIEDNGGEVYYMITDANANIRNRYAYVHAKYAIFDSIKVLISSDNFGMTGHPVDNSYGNRGWDILISNPSVAQYYEMVFDEDVSQNHYDIFRYQASDPKYGAPPPDFVPDTSIPAGSYSPLQPQQSFTGIFTLEPVLSPDQSLMINHSFLYAINNAQTSIDVEMLSMHTYWGPETTGSPSTTPNILLEALINAARRGVSVRILLDSSYFNTDPNNPRDNDNTVSYVNSIATTEGIPLAARLADLNGIKVVKIHNKGMIIDHNKVIISSINGTQGSFKYNREAAIIIDSSDIANYYQILFDYDWNGGSGSPPAQPGDVVINEVAWSGTTANSYHEWIELFNTSCNPINLAGWKIVDDNGTQIYTINSGIIPARGYFLIEDTETATSLFSDAVINLSLADAGDSLQLKDSFDNVIDTVNGTGGPWYAGKNNPKISMERIDACNFNDSPSNWADNNQIIINGTDANNNPILGTPKMLNSTANPSCSLCTNYLDIEIFITNVLKTPSGVKIVWQDVSNLPGFSHYHLYRSSNATAESFWSKIPEEITINEYTDSDNGNLYYYIPVVVSSDGFIEKEGKSGHYDNYFDR